MMNLMKFDTYKILDTIMILRNSILILLIMLFYINYILHYFIYFKTFSAYLPIFNS